MFCLHLCASSEPSRTYWHSIETNIFAMNSEYWTKSGLLRRNNVWQICQPKQVHLTVIVRKTLPTTHQNSNRYLVLPSKTHKKCVEKLCSDRLGLIVALKIESNGRSLERIVAPTLCMLSTCKAIIHACDCVEYYNSDALQTTQTHTKQETYISFALGERIMCSDVQYSFD